MNFQTNILASDFDGANVTEARRRAILIQCLTERNGTERNGTERNGTERNGTERNGTERNGTERNGTERNGTERNGGTASVCIVDKHGHVRQLCNSLTCYSQRLDTAMCYNAKGRIPIFILIG